MVEIAMSSATQIDNPESFSPDAKEGKLQAGEKTYIVSSFQNTEEITGKTFEFLQSFQNKATENPLLYAEIKFISSDLVELQAILDALLIESKTADPEAKEQEKNGQNPQKDPSRIPQNSKDLGIEMGQEKEALQKTTPASKNQPSAPSNRESRMHTEVHTSVFALARTLSLSKKVQENKNRDQASQSHNKNSSHSRESVPVHTPNANLQQNHHENTQRFKEKEEEKQHSDQNSKEHDEEEKKKLSFSQKSKKTKATFIEGPLASSGVHSTKRKTFWEPQASTQATDPVVKKYDHVPDSVGNIFLRVLALMARIIQQAEGAANELYLRIKARTDNIDILTSLLSKINLEKGAIDWTKDEELKKLVDQARAMGVEIPEGKYKWTKDEKQNLIENIRMKKDNMEKVTQTERTDLQRWLQEVSQNHQGRSNILKLIKEINDTFIHNLRPS